jgi:hypothetical protein
MNIIQSFWSKPFLLNRKDQDSRFNGGWLNANFHYYSCLLSCLKFKEFYAAVTLFTDNAGKDILIDKLDIPYTSVNTSLEKINNYPSELWALGKILAYSLQESPFIHADMDVFIWEKFSNKFTNSEIIAQNIEINFPRYKEVLDIVLNNFKNIPSCLTQQYNQSKNIYAFNAGILGGQNIDFFKEYASIVFSFINDNLEALQQVNTGVFNMIYEQVLGYGLAVSRSKKISFYTQSANAAFTNLMKFHTIPKLSTYIHTVGYAKKSIYACEQIKYLLQYEFSKEYEHLNNELIRYNLTERIDIQENFLRYKFLSAMYIWLRNASWNEMLATKFILSKRVWYKELPDSELEISFQSPQTGEESILKIEDWDFFLCYFQKPTSVMDIVKDIKNDREFMKNTAENEIAERLFSFVMDRCIYHEILEMV